MKKGMTKEDHKKLRLQYIGYTLTKSDKLRQAIKKVTTYQCNLQITKQGER